MPSKNTKKEFILNSNYIKICRFVLHDGRIFGTFLIEFKVFYVSIHLIGKYQYCRCITFKIINFKL